MTKLTEYRVLRQHEGDRFYNEGDTRTAAAGDVKHLIPNVLEEIGPAAEPVEAPKEKAEPAPDNKAEGAAPANKAILGLKPAKGK